MRSIIREPMKDHSLRSTKRSNKDVKWPSSSSSRSSRSVESSSTDASSCCDSIASFDDDSVQHRGASRKCVRFAQMSRQRKISSHRKLTVEQKNQIWLSVRDGQQIRLDCRKTAMRACTIDTDYADAINQAAKDVCVLGASTDQYEFSALMTDYQFFDQMAEPLEQLPQSQLEAMETFRGLEDLLSEERRFLRFYVAKQARSMVVQKSKDRQSAIPADELATYYQEKSQTTAVFARLLAVMDEAAAAAVYDQVEDD